MTECAACFAPCPSGSRWCSMACFYAEDGYPDDFDDEDEDE